MDLSKNRYTKAPRVGVPIPPAISPIRVGLLLRLAVIIPVVVMGIALAVTNRQSVTVSFDLFAIDPSAFTVSAPLFAIVLIAAAVGAVAGGSVAALRNVGRQT